MKPARQRRASTTIQERAWPFDPTKYTTHIPNIDGQRRQLVSIIDDHGFNWQVFAVAASGFFTDSYNLFASNVILPALAFVYWPCEHEANTEITINALTLAGSAFGQVIFGFLADKYGRQRLYGVELFIVIFSTIGLAQCSRGILYTNADGSTTTSMSVEAWLMAWRFVMGIGIGMCPMHSLLTTHDQVLINLQEPSTLLVPVSRQSGRQQTLVGE
jgi:PHS family inorganic phosphate transporter-like MFS transporter